MVDEAAQRPAGLVGLAGPHEQDGRAHELAALCRSCGLCCDGSLFGLVPLRADEVDGARKHRLPVIASGKGFTQPCTALAPVDDGENGERACAIYETRPHACHAFECRLFDRHRREGGPIESPLSVVRDVRRHFAVLAASGLDASVFAEADREIAAPLRHAYAELVKSLEDDFARA